MKVGRFEINWAQDVENFWKFWSVRLGIIAGACCAGMAAYAAAKSFDPRFVEHFPQWILDMLAYGSVVFGTAAFIARGVDQPNLRNKP